MSWVKLDDQFYNHPKISVAGPAAAWVYICCLCWSAGQLTDGFLPEPVVERLSRPHRALTVAGKLVKAGLWEEAAGGYQIHDYLDYNPSREQVMAARGVWKRRAAMNNDPELRRIVRGRDGDQCRYCGITVSWSDRKGERGGTYDHVMPVKSGGNEHPDNIVACCRRCNLQKGPRTPEAAGMVLRPVPKSTLDVDGTQAESRLNLDGITPESSTDHAGTKPGSRRNQGQNPDTRSRTPSPLGVNGRFATNLAREAPPGAGLSPSAREEPVLVEGISAEQVAALRAAAAAKKARESEPADGA